MPTPSQASRPAAEPDPEPDAVRHDARVEALPRRRPREQYEDFTVVADLLSLWEPYFDPVWLATLGVSLLLAGLLLMGLAMNLF